MQTLIYDGTINGFLSCVYYCYYQKVNPKLITSNNQIQLGFDTFIKNIATEKIKAEKVKKSIIKHGESFFNIDCAFSYNNEFKDIIILNYLKLLFKFKAAIKNMLNNEDVIAFNNACNKVMFESHKMKGFLRFNETVDGIYYAKIEPDNNIVKFIMPHFIARYNNQKFLIHDIRRNIIGIYDTVKSVVFQNNSKLNIYLSEDEEYIQRLFKNYYKTITITERKNKKLMLGFMAKRYHKHLIELN